MNFLLPCRGADARQVVHPTSTPSLPVGLTSTWTPDTRQSSHLWVDTIVTCRLPT